ncbi:MAG: glycosyltransferase family 2 protein [Candidatus Acidiferrales bacterium]
MKALVVAVHYGNPQPTVELLRCLSRVERRSNVHVLIVGNQPADGSASGLREALYGLADFELHELAANAGYFGAAKAGVDRFLERQGGLPDWIIVCNHDVLIEDRGFFARLFAQDVSAAGVIAPRIQLLPGRMDQNPFMRRRPGRLRWAGLRFSSSSYRVAEVWDWMSRKKRALQSYREAHSRNPAGRQKAEREWIYAPHGSFFIFSRKYFEAGGFLDQNLFLYGEEIFVAETCRSLGLPVIYEPSLSVLHNEHTTTGRRVSRFSYECQKKALRYVGARYFSSSRPPGEPAIPIARNAPFPRS